LRGNLLIVDDEINILKALRRQLSSLQNDNYHIYTVQSGAEALELLQTERIHVIISDQRMPNMTGTQLLVQTKILYPQTIRIILSGYTDFNSVQDAINQGHIYKFLNKPWKTHELLQHIQDAFAYYDIHMEQLQAKQVVMNAIEAIAITDNKHIVQSVNTAFCLSTELSTLEVVGIDIDIFDKESTSEEEINDIYQCITNQGVWQGELLFRKKSGKKYSVFLSISAIRDDSETIARYVYSFIEHTIF